MQEVLEIFKEITKIPHCSFKTQKLKDFIVQRAKEAGARVEVDEAGNILATKGEADICLQSHYDMVCVGKAPQIEIVEEEGFLKAKDSSLGADNGIGVAMMLYFLEKKDNLQALFTNDEEVGLIGANALLLPITAKYLLNLDSEEEGDICLGCAGGADITATKTFSYQKLDDPELKFYELQTVGFIGGHSGVDIDKDIKNAIKVMSYYLKRNSCDILSIQAGEAPNAIPKSVKVKVATKNILKSSDNIVVKECKVDKNKLSISDTLLDMLVSFPSGVRSYDRDLSLVRSSVNLAMVEMDDNTIKITITPRAMSDEEMEDLLLECRVLLESFGFEVSITNKYPAWKPYVGDFAKKIQQISKKYFENPKFYAIHAGLECGVILSKNPHLQAVSIGPNINYPHSTREEVEISSIKKVVNLLDDLLDVDSLNFRDI